MRSPLWLASALGLAAFVAGCPGLGPSADGSPDRDGDGVVNELDCAPNDPGYFRVVTVYVDGDRDGHGAGAPVSLCIGSALFGGYSEDATDCDDARWDAWEVVQRYVDADHDGVGSGPLLSVCGGTGDTWGY